MNTANDYVRARIDSETKERATLALDAMGISVSDAIRMMLVRVARENRLPFDVMVAPLETERAIPQPLSAK